MEASFMTKAIQLQNLRKFYKGAFAPALNDFSLEVKEGIITGLLGPNGAGKTTCINIICGLIKQDEGSVFIFNKSVEEDATAIRKMIGVVPQQIALFGNLTARENFQYIGKLYGLDNTVLKSRIIVLLEKLGLSQHADKRINRFSGGMKRRANIIASLLNEPRMLILDEPTAGVDVQSRALIHQFLKDYRTAGNTILYTSHLLDEAEALCDEVVIIDEGKLITSGTPQQLIQQHAESKKLEDVFLHYTGHSVRD